MKSVVSFPFMAGFAMAMMMMIAGVMGQTRNRRGCVNATNFPDDHDFFPFKVSETESEFWDIEYRNTYKLLRNEIVDEYYVLYQCGTEPPAAEDLPENTAAVISVPLQNGIGLTATTMIPFLELLGLRTEIKAWFGFPGFISSPCLNEMVDDGTITVVNPTSNATAAAELEGIVTFSNGFTDLSLYENNVIIREYSESAVEGGFEWIKFFSAFFNEEAEANRIFEETSDRFECTTGNSEQVVGETGEIIRPTVVWAYFVNYSTSIGFDVAECPNYYCEYASRCSADILWSREGSVDYFGSPIMTIDEFVDFAKDAEHWIFPASNWDEAFAAYGDQLSQLASVQAQQVYDVSKQGLNAWFEQRIAEHDVVLQDFCSVVGTTIVDHPRVWMRNVFTEEPDRPGQCGDRNLPLILRATPCAPTIIFPPGVGCFADGSTVLMEGVEEPVLMQDLKIGDSVLVDTNGRYEKVYSFGHYGAHQEAQYLSVSFGNTGMAQMIPPLKLTPDHMLAVANNITATSFQMIPASLLKVGNVLNTVTGPAVVKSIRSVVETGAYAPFTKSGTIVVNGVVASNYVSLQTDNSNLVLGSIVTPFTYHGLADMGLAPHRLLCALDWSFCESETYNEDGISNRIFGPLVAAQWLLNQNVALAVILTIVVVIPSFIIFAVLEWCVLNASTVSMIAAVVAATVGGMHQLRSSKNKKTKTA